MIIEGRVCACGTWFRQSHQWYAMHCAAISPANARPWVRLQGDNCQRGGGGGLLRLLKIISTLSRDRAPVQGHVTSMQKGVQAALSVSCPPSHHEIVQNSQSAGKVHAAVRQNPSVQQSRGWAGCRLYCKIGRGCTNRLRSLGVRVTTPKTLLVRPQRSLCPAGFQ